MDKRLLAHANWGLVICALLLMAVGLVNLYSASSVRTEEGYYLHSYFEKQLIWGAAGIIMMVASTLFDYKHLKTLAIPVLLLSLILLACVPVLGVTVNNAKRWISLGFFNLQPSEIAKISVLLVAALLLARNKDVLDWKNLAFVFAVCSPPCLFILTQPDLGTTLNLCLLLGGMVLYKGLRTSVLVSCLIGLPIIVYLGWLSLLDYQKERLEAYFNPTKASAKAMYHIIQAKITIGSGQMWGNSFLEGMMSKLRFLPEKHTDFAIAVFSEEWGFVGSAFLISLFCIFLLCIVKTAREAKDRFGAMICVGVFFYFFWQILINISMVVGLMPVVGIPLPFISYGGTAMIVNFIMLGFVLNVSMRRFMFKSS